MRSLKLGFLLTKTQTVAWFNTINTTMNSFLLLKITQNDALGYSCMGVPKQKKPLDPSSNPNLGFKLYFLAPLSILRKKTRNVQFYRPSIPKSHGDFPIPMVPSPMAPEPWDSHGISHVHSLIHQLQKALWAGRGVLRALDDWTAGNQGCFKRAEGVAVS